MQTSSGAAWPALRNHFSHSQSEHQQKSSSSFVPLCYNGCVPNLDFFHFSLVSKRLIIYNYKIEPTKQPCSQNDKFMKII